jgi:hypothetical protein
MASKAEFVLPKGRSQRALEHAQIVLSKLDPAEAWKITAEPVRNMRSHSQNAYLWAVPYRLISEATGYESEEVHEYMLGRFFGWKDKRVPKTPRNPEGVESVPVRTTTTNSEGKRAPLSTTEFSDYIGFIQRFAAIKMGIVVPDPDQFHQSEAA